MTSLKRFFSIIPFVVLLMVSYPSEVRAFGARRQYHSYHHISQSNRNGTSDGSNIRGTTINEHLSSSSSIVTQDETEILLERAARIRALSAQIQGVQLASSRKVTTEHNERYGSD